MAEIGKFLTLCLKYWAKKSQQTSVDSSEEFNFGPLTAIVLTFIYLFTGASVLSLFEEWDLLDSSYFSFVTFSTIGFGDLIPEHQEYLIFTIIYTFTALSLCSMCFCSIQEWVDPYMTSFQQYIQSFKIGKSSDERRKTDYTSSKSANAYKSSPKVQHRVWTKRVNEDEEDDEEESIVD